ncbi:MAG: penicillin-binding protein 2 [Deltaproteobacteria bacterium]|jgi:penicillin-binding protein 2|nr:penicillin-binding protein 2 [Deltaproteobacteria bacterium]
MRIELEPEGYQPPRMGLLILQGFVLLLFCLLVLRLWYLQILRGDYYERQAHSNRWKDAQIYANRGLILDDNGVILAENSPAYSLALIRESCPDIPQTLAGVSRLTGIPFSVIERNFNKARAVSKQSFAPLILAPSIGFEQLARVESQQQNLPGVTILSRQRRYYTQGHLFAHVLGYVSIASDADHKKFPELSIGDTVGKQGLEVVLEDRLRGIKGLNAFEVDVYGRQLVKAVEHKPRGGENIRLSLDADLQRAAMAALGDNAGCVVVMEPDTGRLRALVTAPSYDNNIITANSGPEWAKLLANPRHPLHNRVIQSVYPPGSVWKLPMANMLLAMGVEQSESVHCSGETKLGNRIFRCWKKGGHGRMNMTRALVESCDVYFYLMCERAGIDRITAFASASGFGKLTGIDLPYEKAGQVPGRELKRRTFPKDPTWHTGETYNTSIGQGLTLVTPVQMAVYVSSLLNGGKLFKPLLVDDDGPVIRGMAPSTDSQRKFIVEAMRRTVEDRGGTARRVVRSDAIMGGKTGTAQVVKIGDVRLRAEEMQYEHRDHAWMVSWGIKDDKKYVVVVMVEHGGGGSSVAGPVSAAVYDHLFGSNRTGRPGQKEAANVLAVAGQTPGQAGPDGPDSAYVTEALKAAEAWGR